MGSFLQPTERCRPLLGTFVLIRVHGLDSEDAHAAINAAFDEIIRVQQLMSFCESDSDTSRLNRSASSAAVQVDQRTFAVLQRAVSISQASAGLFDITVAPKLVARGRLPAPRAAPAPDIGASWRDILLQAPDNVSFNRPLWIELGGIAKGYAVDRAIEVLRTYSPTRASVNAGGDMRVIGRECVQLDYGRSDDEIMVVSEIEDGSIASSYGLTDGQLDGSGRQGAHVYIRKDETFVSDRFVSVMAPSCVEADALTKVVMAKGDDSAALLRQFGAYALIYDQPRGWRNIGAID